MTVHSIKPNRAKKTKAQKLADSERLFMSLQNEHDALSTFCNSLWDYEWRVEHISVGDFTKLIDARDKVCSARRIMAEELVADTYRGEDGEYNGENTTLRSSYDD